MLTFCRRECSSLVCKGRERRWCVCGCRCAQVPLCSVSPHIVCANLFPRCHVACSFYFPPTFDWEWNCDSFPAVINHLGRNWAQQWAVQGTYLPYEESHRKLSARAWVFEVNLGTPFAKLVSFPSSLLLLTESAAGCRGPEPSASMCCQLLEPSATDTDNWQIKCRSSLWWSYVVRFYFSRHLKKYT